MGGPAPKPHTPYPAFHIAHREEILDQALATFRRIRPDAHLGKYTGTGKDKNADILFASVQTLSRQQHLRQFPRDHFDYLVMDEFHHAAAATYRRLLDYFDPRFLLGLTATPKRTDGGDLLALCQENLVYRCGVASEKRKERGPALPGNGQLRRAARPGGVVGQGAWRAALLALAPDRWRTNPTRSPTAT